MKIEIYAEFLIEIANELGFEIPKESALDFAKIVLDSRDEWGDKAVDKTIVNDSTNKKQGEYVLKENISICPKCDGKGFKYSMCGPAHESRDDCISCKGRGYLY